MSMKKKNIILIAFFILLRLQLQAQDDLPTYKSETFRSIEVKTGIGIIPLPYQIPINVVYQQNMKRGFSAILYSEFLHRYGKDGSLSLRETIWRESVGIGRTFGNGKYNNGLYLLGGGRYYYSRLVVDADLNENTLTTKKLNPELGLLYNLKVGRKKWYFSTQLYFALTPLKNFSESRHSLMLGVGYRLNARK